MEGLVEDLDRTQNYTITHTTLRFVATVRIDKDV